MVALITEIIEKFGPRTAASREEKHAQLFMIDKCKAFTDQVKLLEFDEYLNARFGKLKYYCALELRHNLSLETQGECSHWIF